MSKRINIRLIKHRESYTLAQIAKTLNIHLGTVQEWRKKGLKTLSNEKPFLVMGYDLKEFLNKKIQSRKTKLEANQFFCTKCRQAVTSKNNEVHLASLNKIIGKHGFKGFIVKGVCQTCSAKLNRFSHEGKLEDLKSTFTIKNMEEYTND